VKTILRRLGHLETRIAVTSRSTFFSARILLVHPENGLTGVLLLETDKPTTRVPATPEEVETVHADLERRRAARLQWNGGARDTHDCAPGSRNAPEMRAS
jgi:hypothetical protein